MLVCNDFVQLKIKLVTIFQIKLHIIIKQFIVQTKKNLEKIFFVSLLMFIQGNIADLTTMLYLHLAEVKLKNLEIT